MAKKPKKRVSRKTHSLNSTSHLNRSFLILGAILIIVSVIWKAWDIYQTSLPTFKNYQPQTAVLGSLETTPKNLFIPDVLINLEVEQGSVEKNNWQISEVGASHLITSSSPSEGGNIVIYGHNWPNLLDKIRELKVGNVIFIISANGKSYNYQVTETLVVDPSEVWVLNQTSEEVLTIYTCTGFFDSKRFVVRAKPVNAPRP